MVYDQPPGDSLLKTDEDRALEARILTAIAEYKLVKAGAATYEQLGYGLPGGQLPAVKLLEFLAIDSAYAVAYEEKWKKD